MSRYFPLRTLLVFLSFLPIGNLFARQVTTGVVTDKVTHQPVDGVTVEMLQLPDSLSAEVAQTNSEGLFMFYKADTAKTYALRLHAAFYKACAVAVTPRKGSMINNVGSVELEPSAYNLKEIVVNGTKMSVTEMADRTVYSIPEGVQKTSSDGVDVLRKIPTVQVDYLNEDITVNGRSNIKIEVDGISRDKGYLKRLHPSQIAKMEVITNPSGKYDSEIDAVINVVTNPAMRYGLKGMVYAGAFPIADDSYLGMYNGSLDYGLEKISWYASSNGAYQQIGIQSDMHREAGTSTLDQNSKQDVQAHMLNINAGFIYDPDEKNDLTFNLAYNNMNMKSGGETWNRTLSGSLTNLMKTETNSVNASGGLTSSMFYKHTFDKKKQHALEAELNYYNSLGNKTNSTFSNYYLNAADSSVLLEMPQQSERSSTNVQNLYGQSNYNLPIDTVTFINLGLNANYNHYLTDNTSTAATIGNLDYQDLRMGGFAEYARTFSKGSLKLGTRFENSLVTIGSSDPHAYRSLLPYVNGLYRFNKDNSLKLSYSRRVIRPSSSQLNPMVSVVDSQTISKGNLDLKPAYRDNFQLTYQMRLPVGKMTFNLSPQAYYEKQTGLIQNVISKNSTTGRFENMPVNISDGNEYGGSLAVNSQLGQFLFNSNFRYSFYHVDAYLDQIAERNRQGWSWNAFAMCPLPRNFQLMGMIYMNGPVLNGQVESRSSTMHLLGLGKQFKNNGVLRFMAYNPFSRYFFRSTSTIDTESLKQQQHSFLKKDYGFLLMYVYSFKIGQSIERQKRTVEQQAKDNLINLPVSF